MSAILTARGITKRFPGVVALRDVSFDLRAGEIHALCGENGAGKSTLIKLLSGLHPHGSYEGEFLVSDQPAHFRGIADAERAGLAVIYQELALVEQLSVAENIFLGAEPRRLGLIDWPRVHREARALLDRFGVKLDPHLRCDRLGVGEKQLVEIVKALRKESRILILDEPTAALAEHEVQILLTILRDLRARGIACIYISHKLDEVFSLADRITVLRDGSTIWTKPARETSKADVIRAMVGREIADLFPRRAKQGEADLQSAPPGLNRTAQDAPPAASKSPTPFARQTASLPHIFRIEALTVCDEHTGRERLSDISFSLAPGEVLGLGGLMGAGRTELLMHVFGAWGRRHAGRVELAGHELPPLRPAEILRRGLVLVSEDRRRYGLVLEQTIGFNLSLSSLARLTRRGFIDASREFQKNDALFRSLRVKAPGMEARVGKLSGGNQQKVVLGKALMTEPQVIFLDEPTRGIDVGAKLEIYEIINQLTDAGKAVVLVSSELPELMGMSDRILMLHEGRIGGEFTRAEATPERLLQAALGHPTSAGV
ncbi:MAG: D-xylose transport system ATP-binding protein [Chthoniobacter sp.]|jgi:D-xylose transport system ATP-binding protein|nr:D-xylose transport system ATP-binding protein [Chthoniobacter sp.]